MRLSGAGASRLSVPLQILPSVRANIKNTAEPLLLVVPWPAAKQNLVYGIFYDYVSCHNLLIKNGCKPSKSPNFLAARLKKRVLRTCYAPPLREFPPRLWTHLPVGLSAPFRPRAQAASSPPPPPISSGFSVLFCRLYFAATSGVCLIRSGAPLVFKRNHTRKRNCETGR